MSSSEQTGAKGLPAATALDKVVYEELRREARRILGRHTPGHSVTPSVLVHDAYIRLLSSGGTAAFTSELHFRAAASLAMRHVLVDRARRRNAHKHGRGWSRVALVGMGEVATAPMDVDLLALSEAIEQLVLIDPDAATIVQMRFFGELTHEEIAESTGMSLRSVERGWRAARAWLLDRLKTA